MKTHVLTTLCFCLFCILQSNAQRTIEYNATLESNLATEKNLPFWQVSNRYGLIPQTNNGLLRGGFFSGFAHKHAIDFSYGLSAEAYISDAKNKIIPDQLYISAQWKHIRLDLGMIHPETEYNGISSTNGNMIFSGNGRTMPGYNLRTAFINVPLTHRILAFKFNWADYTLIDDRFVDQTYLHNKSFFINIKPIERLDIIVGVEHWAQWGGTSPVYGRQPSSFRDYVRVFWGREGGLGSTMSDSINALGNHLGREHIRINYHADRYTLTFYHDIPFEDGSGTRFANFPDGVYGFWYGAKNRKQWISDVMYEFYYTKDQSGPHHDRPATSEEQAKQDPDSWAYGRVILGGNDNYFNNGEYKSGWTYYGQTIGTPFITPQAPDDHGITLGVYNNRILAHYLGIQGYARHKLPYKLRLSYSINYGTYGQPLPEQTQQFSFGLETGIWNKENAPLHIGLGIYGDFGKLLKDNFGFTVTLSKGGKIK